MKRVLVAAMHWGLGHATRSVPLITCLLKNEFEVIIASDGAALNLLMIEFPQLLAIELPSYQISYKSENMFRNLVNLLPGAYSAIKAEKKSIERLVVEHDVNIIISDNRFGCFSSKCRNIFVTHQINIQTGNFFFDWVAKKVNLALISKFDQIWIPDAKKEPSLSGILSHHFGKTKLPVKYMGVLSRFESCKESKKSGILIILSGPEPQKTIFENKILNQALGLRDKITIVRGEVNGRIVKSVRENITVYNYADAPLLNMLMCESEVVVSRSGYTTIMDVAITGSKALLVPTPGQTEQIYLAKHLKEQGLYAIQDQKHFNLEKGIFQAHKCKVSYLIGGNQMDSLVKSLLS